MYLANTGTKTPYANGNEYSLSITESVTSLSSEQESDQTSLSSDSLLQAEQAKVAYLQQLEELRLSLQKGNRSYFSVEKKKYVENVDSSLSFESKIAMLNDQLQEILQNLKNNSQNLNAREYVKCEMQARMRVELNAALVIEHLSVQDYLGNERSYEDTAQKAALWMEHKTNQLQEVAWWEGYKKKNGVIALQIDYHQRLAQKCEHIYLQLMAMKGAEAPTKNIEKTTQPHQKQSQVEALKRKREEISAQTVESSKRQKRVMTSTSLRSPVSSSSLTSFPLGLPNIGNSCYINVALQIVFMIDELQDKIFQAQDGMIASIAKLCSAKTGLKMESLLHDIRGALCKKAKWSSINSQQDANETLLMIFDCLDWAPIKMHTRIQNGSMLHDISYQQSNQLSMSLSASHFQDIIDNNFKFEEMAAENKLKPWVLNSNGQDHILHAWQQAICIDEYPQHLVVELKQPIDQGRRCKKKIVEFPKDQIVEFPHSEGPVNYEIVGYVNHRSITSLSNHYTVLVKSAKKQEWLLINDTRISSAEPIMKSADICFVLLKKVTS